jgi:hypothetical protein
VEHLSYYWLYWIPLAMATAAVIATVLVVPESPVRASGGVNWPGAALMPGWLVALLVAVSEGPFWGWRSGSVLGLFGAAVGLLAAWTGVERRSRTPLVDMGTVRNPTVAATNAASLLIGFGMFAASW